MKRQYYNGMPTYNQQIHKDNPYYANPPDFKRLAENYPYLQQYLQQKEDGSVIYQFNKKNATKDLTKALFKQDFHIEWDIPENHLCPGLTGHINYLNEIHDILKVDPTYSSKKEMIKGVDIGTGASCVYPLLGTVLYKWKFIATDIDSESIQHAQHLVERNHLEDFIQCQYHTKDQPVLKDIIDSSISFTMCNPPFFEDEIEIDQNPHSHTLMTENESITEGGEIKFIKQIIEESSHFQSFPILFSSLVGKKKSLKHLLTFLKEMNFLYVGTCVLYQGKTVRWCLFWTNHSIYGEYINQHPFHYKVFNRKKREKQFEEKSFHFQLSIEEVEKRIKDFCERCEGITYSSNQYDWQLQITSFHYQPPSMKPCNQQPSSLSSSLQAVIKLHLENNQNQCTMNSSLAEPFNPSVTSIVIEQLENDIRRENRKWRRYLQNTSSLNINNDL